MKRRYLLVLVFLLIGLLPVAAQAAPGTPTPNEVDTVARELWCPLCNGVRLDNCDLQACVQMRDLIAQKLAAGENKDQIKTYFVQQYGEVVLGAPADQGFGRLAWVLPVLAAVVALAWLVYLVRAWTRRRPAAAVPASQDSGRSVTPGDEYIQRVDDELKRYE